MKYIVNKPVKFVDHFVFHEDNTPWNGYYLKTKDGHFPALLKSGTRLIREKCKIGYKDYIKPISEYSDESCSSGLYLLFFCNYQAYYVGLATENIVDRLSKHIVKVFGSYVGVGVNHTDERKKGWRYLAKEIYKNYKRNEIKYNLEDCYLVTVNPKEITETLEDDYKDKLKYIENILSNENHPLIEKIIDLISRKKGGMDWRSFNAIEKGVKHEYKLLCWKE